MNARKRLSIALVMLLTAGGLGVLALGYDQLRPAWMEHRLSISPDGRNRVRVLIGAPFIFGPHPLRIEVKRAGDIFFRMVAKTILANDGKSLRPSNLTFRWPAPDRVRLCLTGEEQKPTAIVITMTAPVRVEKVLGCTR